jgi:hypothetical protein
MNLASTGSESNNNFRVGSRVQIQPELLEQNCQHLAYAKGEIKKIQDTSLSRLQRLQRFLGNAFTLLILSTTFQEDTELASR